MTKLTLGLLALSLAGCASTSGIVPMGPDTYMISRQAGSGFAGLGHMKADSIREGGEFCSQKGKQFQLVSASEVPGGLGTFPHAEINFTCLNPGDPGLTRPKGGQ